MGCVSAAQAPVVEEEPQSEAPPSDLPRSASGLLRRQATAATASTATASQPALVALLRKGALSKEDVWMQASFGVQLQKVLQEHPYLEPLRSAQPHPLQASVRRCRECSEARKFKQAHQHLRCLIRGLEAEARPVAEAFRRFDTDASGHLDAAEFRHMCAYLGWGEEEADLMDLDRDGRVTLGDMQAFVGYMGGVRQLFEKRRLRITASRKDVCDYAGIAVGARVRAHFYIRGQKSRSWKEALVLGVGVERKRNDGAGPATYGVLLEFGFGQGPSASRWRARQVVPTSWVLSGVEEEGVASALREVGILDDQQSFWSLLLPESETKALEELESNQRAAIAYVRGQSTTRHESALTGLREKFEKLGFGEEELQATLGWVQDLAPVVIHLHIDQMGHFMETDEYYRSQFETKTSCGSGSGDQQNTTRKGWEHNLFGGCYDDAKPFERCKYGALNVMNDYRGVLRAWQYGDSYLVLKDVRLRCTFAATDSGGISAQRLAVLDKYAHVLNEYSDMEIKGLVEVAMAALAPESSAGRAVAGSARLQILRGSKEDSTADWVTAGFPGLKQRSGCYYFEVLLVAGCQAPQVGVLSSGFEASPGAASTQGVGDDVHGWAVDGQNAARWHGGCSRAWEGCWPTEMPTGSSASRLAEDVVVGVAVDLDSRQLWFSTNGTWDAEAAFGPNDVPKGTLLYPAVSLKGRGGFLFGPDFKHAPPRFGRFLVWPSTAGGTIRVDCTHVGDSNILGIYKEVQVHGAVSLKKNVLRLVANSKYRQKPKTQRSYALRVSGLVGCNGSYERVGAQEGRPLYRSQSGGVICWDTAAQLWRLSPTGDISRALAAAPPIDATSMEPPRAGWKVPDELRGILPADAFREALEAKGVGSGDARELAKKLAHKDGTCVLWVKGEISLENEWKSLRNPQINAKAAWNAAVQVLQQRFLVEAGLPQDAHIIETVHPYEAKRHSWRREVRIPGSLALRVHFAPQTCTLDERTRLKIFAGGVHRNTAGPGARVEVGTPDFLKVWGTVVERPENGKRWRVRLDRRSGSNETEAEADGGAAEGEGRKEDDSWPGVGNAVEAKYSSGAWYAAMITEVIYASNWYDGTRRPSSYMIAWYDGDRSDREKTREELRRPSKRDAARRDLEALPRYGHVAEEGADCFALCADSPCVARVAYSSKEDSKVTVGSEVAAFGLQRACPLMPVVVQSFAGNGPAQEQGVKEGWYLDLISTARGPSRDAIMLLLQGLAGAEPEGASGAEPAGSGRGRGRGRGKSRAKRKRDDTTDEETVGTDAPAGDILDKFLDAAFSDLDGLLRRLNEGLRALSDVTLVFSDSSAWQQVRLLPEALATYAGGQRVGSEVRQFRVLKNHVMPEGFLTSGPAQQAGVRTDWALDCARTVELNPDKAGSLKEDMLVENPNCLLSLSDVVLVFKQPHPQKSQLFMGSGAASNVTWNCSELPGDCADFEFSTDGDGGDDPEKRWGVWAVVLPESAPVPSSQTLSAVASQWAEATSKAQGIDEVPTVERDGWDESRLRALCQRHGWEFEWMAEDGERRRLVREHQAAAASGQLAQVAKNAVRPRAPEAKSGGEAEARPDGYEEHPEVEAGKGEAATAVKDGGEVRVSEPGAGKVDSGAGVGPVDPTPVEEGTTVPRVMDPGG